MAKVTSLEAGLKRILGLRPDIILHPKDIQLIIDGNLNEVLNKTKRTVKKEEETKTITTTFTTDEDTTDSNDITTTFTNDAPIELDTDKPFDEYFTSN